MTPRQRSRSAISVSDIFLTIGSVSVLLLILNYTNIVKIPMIIILAPIWVSCALIALFIVEIFMLAAIVAIIRTYEEIKCRK